MIPDFWLPLSAGACFMQPRHHSFADPCSYWIGNIALVNCLNLTHIQNCSIKVSNQVWSGTNRRFLVEEANWLFLGNPAFPVFDYPPSALFPKLSAPRENGNHFPFHSNWKSAKRGKGGTPLHSECAIRQSVTSFAVSCSSHTRIGATKADSVVFKT